MCCEKVGSVEAGELRVQLREPGTAVVLDGNMGVLRVGDTGLMLTPIETKVLWVMMCNAGSAVSPHELLDHVWTHGHWGSVQTMYSSLSRTANKIIENEMAILWEVRRGFGYLMDGFQLHP